MRLSLRAALHSHVPASINRDNAGLLFPSTSISRYSRARLGCFLRRLWFSCWPFGASSHIASTFPIDASSSSNTFVRGTNDVLLLGHTKASSGSSRDSRHERLVSYLPVAKLIAFSSISVVVLQTVMGSGFHGVFIRVEL